jgi:hypothetical protein
MGSPDQVLPGSSVTCSQYEEAVLSELSSQDCQNNTRDDLVGGNVIDLFAFCGCPGFSSPNLCSLCDGDAVSITRSPPVTKSGETLSCSDIASLAPFVLDSDFCQEAIQVFSGICCNSNDGEASCSICASGSEIGNPGREIFFLDGKTCGAVDGELSLVSMEGCSKVRGEIAAVFNLEAWCGCEGAEPTQICAFCTGDDEYLIDPDYQFSDDNSLTCKDAMELAAFISNASFCEENFGWVARGCCASKNRCSICPQGVSMAFPERTIMLAEGEVCGRLDFSLGFVPPEECDNFKGFFGQVDLGSWCGCEGAQTPNECSLCGQDLILVNEHLEVPDGADGLTCGDIAELAPYVADDGFCKTQVFALRGECCGVKPQGSPPAESPVSKNGFPKAGPVSSAPDYLSTLFGTCAVAVGGWLVGF